MGTAVTKTEGICLLIGCFLMFITMVMHPTGGDMAHLLEIWVLAVASHSIAIASIPFVAVGFSGLQRRLRAADFLSKMGYAILLTGLVAVMIAAALNGLVYPIYVDIYAEASESTIDSLEGVMRYGFAMNRAFDYIFMAAVCGSTLLWSIAIIRTKSFPAWLGYVGLVLSVAALGAWSFGFDFVDLQGLRIFVLGWIVWSVIVGYLLLFSRNMIDQ